MTRRAPAPLLGALLALALLVGCGGSSTSSNTGSSTATGTTSSTQTSGAAIVKTSSNDLGTILTDGNGRTLYLFESDTGPQSTCSGACAQNWPPLTTSGRAQAAGGATAGMLSTSKRVDGTTQVVYDGHPLYYFADDTAAGDTNGQAVDAFGAEWYVLGPDGAAITSQAAGGGNSGGGGY